MILGHKLSVSCLYRNWHYLLGHLSYHFGNFIKNECRITFLLTQKSIAVTSKHLQVTQMADMKVKAKCLHSAQ